MSHFFTTEISDPRFEPDGLRLITVKSNALKSRADITVFDPSGNSIAGIPVVILLHGVYGSHWAWTHTAGVHHICRRLILEKKIRPMLLVMPSDGLYGDGSAYLPHTNADYEKWIVDDVMQVVREQVSAVNEESAIFITGLSMGGFGAMRIGSKYPDLFNAFSGMSSITHFDQMEKFVKDFEGLKKNAMVQDGVLEWMIRNKNSLPPFRFDCGRDDLLIEHNRQLHRSLDDRKIVHHYEEFAGAHSWEYWSTHIEDTLLFFEQNC